MPHLAKTGSIETVDRRRGLLTPVLVGLVLLSLNLRPAAVSVGPVLDEVRDGLGMSAAAAGLLTSLPVIAFAGFGALAPAAARRIGPHRVDPAGAARRLRRAARAGRWSTTRRRSSALSLLALAGWRWPTCCIPSLVKRHYPDRIGTMTAVYTTALAIGLTSAFVLTVPVAHAFGVLARRARRVGRARRRGGPPLARPGEPRHRRPRLRPSPDRAIGFRDVARTRLGWAMAAFFGLQSLQAYAVFGWFATLWRDAGYSAAQAGALVGVVAATSIPLSAWSPRAIARPGDQRRVLVGVMRCYPVAYLGLVVAPYSLAVLWAVVLGAATTTFPIVLTLIGLRAATPEGTAALSGFTQSTGYLLAAIGPFGVGVLHDATGGWTVPLLVLTALVVPMVALGVYVARPAVPRGPAARSPPLGSRHDGRAEPRG